VQGQDLERLPLVAHAPTRAHVESELRTHGIEARFVLQADSGAAVQGLVAAGLGAAVLPRLATDDRRAETDVLELAPETIAPRTVAAVWSRLQPLRVDAAAFVDAARSACAAERLREPSIA
jgi:DNA-binding transcriptional LysR family regulator